MTTSQATSPTTDNYDASIRVKLMLAESSDQLDLSECNLACIPPPVFDLPNLEELSLAGNSLTSLPPEIGKLTSLKRLQLSGNYLETLPDEIGALTSLQGLWLHGNLLHRLPDTIAGLRNLLQLSIAGNRLEHLPEAIGSLVLLKELTAAGNRLSSLPKSLGALSSLEILGLHGNRLSSRGGVENIQGDLHNVKELWLQGNRSLTELPATLASLTSLVQLSAADCALQGIPKTLRDAPALTSLSLYGNRIEGLPTEVLEAPSLRGVWVEGNPLSAACVRALVEWSGASRATDRRITLGLDKTQVQKYSSSSSSSATGIKQRQQVQLQVSRIWEGTSLGGDDDIGYFKLEQPTTTTSTSSPFTPSKVLVVAFGSAPGVPNWGGLLKKVRAAATEDEHLNFDVLYVVDPARGWYRGGGSAEEFRVYEDRLKSITQLYRHVVMIGDSMGGTAALLFAGQATSVHAFCPQVDLTLSSIRPGEGREWGEVLKDRVLAGVRPTSTSTSASTEMDENSVGDDEKNTTTTTATNRKEERRITVHVGNWKHDLDQANILPKDDVHVRIYSVNSHRLAVTLERADKLMPLIRGAILNEMGLSGNNIRLSNLF